MAKDIIKKSKEYIHYRIFSYASPLVFELGMYYPCILIGMLQGVGAVILKIDVKQDETVNVQNVLDGSIFSSSYVIFDTYVEGNKRYVRISNNREIGTSYALLISML